MITIKEELKNCKKEVVYELYSRIVYKTKDYDKITCNKMIEDIIKEYKQTDYLFYICTKKELDFLKYISENKLTEDDLDKYEWEMSELNKKCIFSVILFEVFEEQKENVKHALEEYKKCNYIKNDDVVIFMISMVKIHANILVYVLGEVMQSGFNMDKEAYNSYLGHPLIHFYLEFLYEEIDNISYEIISYRDYYPILDELNCAKEAYGIAGSLSVDTRDINDIFYYGFPIRKKEVKEMYDLVSKNILKDILFKEIDYARVLNDRTPLKFLFKEKELEIINKALDECSCSAMCGFTKNQYEERISEEMNLDKKFSRIPQINAHLSNKSADHYYKLYFALLEYTNKKYNISKDIKKIYKQTGVDITKLRDIDKYLWNNKNIIDDFINDNDYNFTNEELLEVKEFKNAISSKTFIIVGYEREYTKILSKDGKLYMVKGIRSNIDEIVNAENIPAIVSTTLLMYDGKIVFKSFFEKLSIKFGNEVKEAILNDMKCAIVHYHL